MMEIEELESVDESTDRQYIYCDTLYHKVNSKLKQLKVLLKRGITLDGSHVFNLEIRGVKHSYHFNLDFTSRELCFLHFEEFQDLVKDTSCWSCFDRNFYPSVVYSRILLILYLDSHNGGEAKCIKVPFIQRGNLNSVTKLRKLQDIIYNNIAPRDELKHWPVQVIRCGDKTQGERVFICLTKYALVIIYKYTIHHYHAFHNCDISIQCLPEHRAVEFTIHDKTLSEDTDNFYFHKVYTFATNQADHIERSFNELVKKSQLLPKQTPKAHYNIHRSEQSASVQIGTTSDNVTIIPHKPCWNDNNNSGSGSGSNIPTEKISNLNNTPVPIAHTSSWFNNVHSTSSNGSVPVDNSDIFSTHTDVIRYSTDRTMVTRGPVEKWPDDSDLLDEIYNDRHRKTVEVQINSVPLKAVKNQVQMSNAHLPLAPTDSAPLSSNTDRITSHQKKNSLPNMEDWLLDSNEELKFLSEEEANSLPPPPPCPAFSQPFGMFPKKEDNLTSDQDFHSVPMKLVVPCRAPKKLLRRSQSYLDIPKPTFLDHFYVNISQEMCSRGSVHDDSPYYRFYYNVGLIRSLLRISQRKKLERVNRLSQELKEINMNDLNSHEQWYDRDFQERNRDFKFCSIYNIKPEVDHDSDYSRVDEDDPYWTQNDLCITIQRLLEEEPKCHRLFTEVQRSFDLTAEQLMEVQVLLSLVPAVNNWKNLAEYIGLTSGDITIIEHFCYTYRKLCAYVVLVHWLFKFHKNESIRPCNRESLLNFLVECNRRDITVILNSRSENEHMQSEEDVIATTHF